MQAAIVIFSQNRDDGGYLRLLPVECPVVVAGFLRETVPHIEIKPITIVDVVTLESTLPNGTSAPNRNFRFSKFSAPEAFSQGRELVRRRRPGWLPPCPINHMHLYVVGLVQWMTFPPVQMSVHRSPEPMRVVPDFNIWRKDEYPLDSETA